MLGVLPRFLKGIMVTLAALPFFTSFAVSYSIIGGAYYSEILFFFLLSTLLLFVSSIYLVLRAKIVRLNTVDLLLFAYWAWSLVSLLIVSVGRVTDQNFMMLTGLIVYFFVVKNLILDSDDSLGTAKLIRRVMLVGILLPGLLQSVYGLLQIYGVDPFYTNEYFHLRGTFGNPDPYAGYLTSIIVFAFGFFQFTDKSDLENRPLRILSLGVVIVGLLVIPSTRIRTSWIAIFSGFVFILATRLHLYQLVKAKLKNRRNLNVAIVVASVFALVASNSLYHMKRDSANGRLLIWKVSLGMISEKPIIGFGYDQFRTKYDDFQARYFQSTSGTAYERLIADNVHYAHNEIIQTWVELGLVGVSLLILLGLSLAMQFKELHNNNDNHPEKNVIYPAYATLLSMLVYSLFAFPIHILPTFINMIFFLAILSSYGRYGGVMHVNITSPKFRVLYFSMAIVSVFLFLQVTKSLNDYRIWHDAYYSTVNGDFDKAKKKYECLCSSFEDNGSFLNMFGNVLLLQGDYQRATEELEKATKYLNDSNVWVALGKCYEGMGKLDSAEAAYRYASNITPDRFYQMYLLAKVLEKEGKSDDAIKEARLILNLKPKIQSTAINEMKENVRETILGAGDTYNQNQ